MSASLVGSEMCIRDRALSFARCQWVPSAEAGDAPRALALASAAASAHEAVSYTHLTLPTICSV
eukprot:10544570-Alexandrium_andersonii.AAC.1